MDKYCDNNDNNNLIMDKNIEDNSDDIKNDVNLDCCWKNKQLNCKQNNITTTTATTTTTTITTNKIYHKNGEKTNDTEMDEQRNKDEEKQPIKSDNDDDDDDDDDDEDSTDNLSYLNENDIIDDIILLPSDDELSNNADDCIIYAYRGSANDLQQNLQQNRRINQQQQQQPDDETDFLEMDFDPEPTSETDIYCGGGGVNDDDDDIINNGFNIKKKLLVMNGSNLNSVSNGGGVSGGGGIGEFDCNYYRSSNNDDAGYDNNFISTIETQSKILGTEIIQNLLPSTTEFIPIIKPINKVPLLEGKNLNFSNQNKELPINIVNLLPKEKENLIITTTTTTSPLLSSTAATTTTKTTATTTDTKISTSTADLGTTTTTAATITTTTTPIILLETNNKINKITGTKPKKPQQQDINKINNSRMQQQQQQQQQSQMYNNFSNHHNHHHHQYHNHNQNLNNQTTINCHNIDSSHELFNNKNKLTTKISQHNQQQSPYSTQTQTTTTTSNNHHICLDCTENEFLFNTTNNRGENRTINDNCRNLCSKNKENTFNQFQQQQQQQQYKNMKINQTRADKIQNLGLNLNELNTFDSGIKKLTKLQFLLPNFNTQNVLNDLCYGFDNDKISTEKTINIYSLNCDEKILTDSLRMIDIVPADINIIKQYFNDINRDTIDMSIPEYILHLSKSNCDYNKLITLIRTSCINYNLEFYFCPEDPFSSTPETINIQTSEIIKRWNTNTNLKEIMKIKNKHFHTMNILGKIINILRQPTKQLSAENYIKIPQYYKSGFIRITKKENFK